mmetsp:Transcript_11240/g.23339  ORF Transcript_11240/g.23339 Transcript_11240/m.23339 type:complete len:82 (-) Transcript_11240:3-248(-)
MGIGSEEKATVRWVDDIKKRAMGRKFMVIGCIKSLSNNDNVQGTYLESVASLLSGIILTLKRGSRRVRITKNTSNSICIRT